MKTYFRNLWAAICGRRIVERIEVPVMQEVVAVRDLSLTAADIEAARKDFPIQTWQEGVTLNDFARSDGEQRVIRWFERRTGTRMQTATPHRQAV